MVLVFNVYGKPQTAGSKRAFVIPAKEGKKARAIITDDNKHGGDWKRDVKRAALAAMDDDAQLMMGPLRVRFAFRLERAKGHYGSGKNSEVLKPSAPAYPTSKPDVLKLARCAEDALTGVVWGDDAQITTELLTKRFCSLGERPGCEITIEGEPKYPAKTYIFEGQKIR